MMIRAQIADSSAQRQRNAEGDADSPFDEDSLTCSTLWALDSGMIAGELELRLPSWANTWATPQLLDDLEIVLNPRLRTTIARWVIGSNRLEVGRQFFASSGMEQILCHELAHAAAVTIHGYGVRPHGREWRGLVRQAGFEPVAHHKVARPQAMVATSKRRSVLFEHRCTVCQAIRYARKPVLRWRCTECVSVGLEGNLQIARAGFTGAGP